MTNEQFEEWRVDVHCVLFHVMKTDLDDIHGVRIDQLTVLELIVKNPKVLKHETLENLLKHFDVLI